MTRLLLTKHLQLIGVHVITKDLNVNGGLLLSVCPKASFGRIVKG